MECLGLHMQPVFLQTEYEKNFYPRLFSYSKTCVKRPLSKRQKFGFQDRLSINSGQNYCRMHSAILSTLSFHSSLRSLFCLFLSGRLRQVLLYHYLS